MGENSKISWCDATFLKQCLAPPCLYRVANAVGLVVLQVMAWAAERDPIVHIKSKFWMGRKRQLVMCAKVSALTVTAFLACVVIALKYLRSPIFVLWPPSIIESTLKFAVTEIVALTPARSPFSRYSGNLCSRLGGVLYSVPWRFFSDEKFSFLGHNCLGRIRMHPSLKGGNSPFQLTTNLFRLSSRSIFTEPALRTPAIVPSCIQTKIFRRFPNLAAVAQLKSFGNQLLAVLQRKPRSLCFDLKRTKCCLCH